MQLEWFKKYRDNETKTMSALKSLTFFVSFLLILGIVCYGNRDYHQYLMGKEIKAMFPRVAKVSIFILFHIINILTMSLVVTMLSMNVLNSRLALNTHKN